MTDKRCVCGHDRADHVGNCHEFRPVEEAKPDVQVLVETLGKCFQVLKDEAEEAKPCPATESVYEWARNLVHFVCGPPERGHMEERHTIFTAIHAAIDAGESAEKRAEAAEARIAEAWAEAARQESEILAAIDILKPSMPEDGLIPAIKNLQQAHISEREAVKELEAEVERLRAKNTALGHIAYEKVEGHDE